MLSSLHNQLQMVPAGHEAMKNNVWMNEICNILDEWYNYIGVSHMKNIAS